MEMRIGCAGKLKVIRRKAAYGAAVDLSAEQMG